MRILALAALGQSDSERARFGDRCSDRGFIAKH